MNIQLVIVDPRHLGDGDTTIVMGVIQSSIAVDNYTVSSIAFETDQDGLTLDIPCIEKGETLLDRDLDNEDLDSLNFHSVLKRPVWMKPEDKRISGEITLVKTDIPYQPDDLNSYVFFGIVSNRAKELTPFSSHVYQGIKTAPLLNKHVQAKLQPVGIRAPHTTGNHLILPLTYPIWGFGKDKVGMRSPINDAENQRFATARKLITDISSSDQDIEKAVRINPALNDKEYIDYLKYLEKSPALEGFRDALWVTRDQANAFKSVGKKYTEKMNPSNDEVSPWVSLS